MEDDVLCCSGCQAIDRLWPRLEQARAILLHRPANEETVLLALKALNGTADESGAE